MIEQPRVLHDMLEGLDDGGCPWRIQQRKDAARGYFQIALSWPPRQQRSDATASGPRTPELQHAELARNDFANDLQHCSKSILASRGPSLRSLRRTECGFDSRFWLRRIGGTTMLPLQMLLHNCQQSNRDGHGQPEG